MIINQGYSLNETIKLLATKKEFKIIFDELSLGESFTQTLKILKFDHDILLVIEISETSGELLLGINKALNIIEQKIKNKNEVGERLKYPIILGIILTGAIYFVSHFLLPMFINVYDNFGIEMSIKMLIFFKFLQLLPQMVISLIIILLIINFYIKLQESSDIFKLIMKNKLIKKQYYKMYNQIFLLNLYNLLDIGLKLDEIFLIFATQKYNYLLQVESKKIYQALLQGEELHKILKKRKIYNEALILAIKEGFKYNTLNSNLKNNLLVQELSIEKKTQKYLFLIQPLFYLFFGIIIIMLYACIFLPMFKIMDGI